MRTLLLLFALCGLTGCSQWYYDLGDPLFEQNVPEQGATLAQALAQLGPPQRVSADGEGLVLAWDKGLIPLEEFRVTSLQSQLSVVYAPARGRLKKNLKILAQSHGISL